MEVDVDPKHQIALALSWTRLECPDDEFMTVAESAELLKLNDQNCTDWDRQRLAQSPPVGSRRGRVRHSALNDFLGTGDPQGGPADVDDPPDLDENEEELAPRGRGAAGLCGQRPAARALSRSRAHGGHRGWAESPRPYAEPSRCRRRSSSHGLFAPGARTIENAAEGGVSGELMGPVLSVERSHAT